MVFVIILVGTKIVVVMRECEVVRVIAEHQNMCAESVSVHVVADVNVRGVNVHVVGCEHARVCVRNCAVGTIHITWK
jgi:hypothetical protein